VASNLEQATCSADLALYFLHVRAALVSFASFKEEMIETKTGEQMA
jgi:hypothetical protein